MYTTVISIVINLSLFAQHIPASYSNISRGEDGKLYLQVNDTLALVESPSETWLTLQNLKGNPQGTEAGFSFDFINPEFAGTMYYGFIPYDDSRHPQPIYFYSRAKIENGKASINMNRMTGKFDMIGWDKTGKGTLGYRVVDSRGRMLYDGKISFKGKGPFEIDDTIIEGPFINLLQDDGATISFTTNHLLKAQVEVDGQFFSDKDERLVHEIKLSGLNAHTNYQYTVHYGQNKQSYSFQTAPKSGSRQPFTFAYAADSRSGSGGGERDLHGANMYTMKKIMALNSHKEVAFMQFTGDLINGYLNNIDQMHLQYANWKSAIGPFAHFMPVVAAMGNHETLIHKFVKGKKHWYSIDQFPYSTKSSEAVFVANFVNPKNGPESEDGSAYDPSKEEIDFPSYKENVFYYIYDNVAIIVLNTNYWYTPSLKRAPFSSGNLHGYIMDNQFQWVKSTLIKLENDNNIDHIFITGHTPFFPNGGHVGDDMYYGGDNKHRPLVAGKPVKKGIIERRDELLNLIVNESEKVRVILAGDEHNYCRTEIGPQTEIYPQEYELPKVKLKRTIWQINNGSAGAPYYAQEQTPWTNKVKGFTTQNVVVYFHVDGKKIEVEVQNPDTLEPVERFILTN